MTNSLCCAVNGPFKTYTKLLSIVQDVVVDEQVVAEVVEVSSHVAEKTADLGSQVNDMGGAVLLEDSLGGSRVTKLCQGKRNYV